MFNYLIVFTCIIFGVIGQVFFKKGMLVLGGFDFTKIFSILFSPSILLGFLFYGSSSILWLYVLSKFELSKIYPVLSLSYIGTLFAGYFLFGEAITFNKIIGILLICFGIIFLQK